MPTSNQQPSVETWKSQWFATLRNPRVLVLVLLALMAREAVVFGIQRASGGMIDLKSKEQDVLACVVRSLLSADFVDDTARVASMKVCIPKKLQEEARDE